MLFFVYMQPSFGREFGMLRAGNDVNDLIRIAEEGI
jgi:hypothetical protein